MILVLGGGFGLYGHLAAIARFDRPMATLSRYRPIVSARTEMAAFAERIEWVDDEAEACARASTVVLARRPGDNEAVARRLLKRSEGGILVIEKPIAPSPAAALDLGAAIDARGRHWAVPYLFLYCDWYDAVHKNFARDDRAKIELHWSFRQSPLSRAWKRASDEGGGPLAFYFIQLIAVAERLLPKATRSWSQDKSDEGMTLILDSVDGEQGLRIRFDLDLQANAFSVRDGTRSFIEAATPFGAVPAAGTIDPRVCMLESFYRDAVFASPVGAKASYRAINRVWRDMANDFGSDRLPGLGAEQ